MNIENALLRLNDDTQLIILSNEKETEYKDTVPALLDLINHGCQNQITIVTGGCGRAVAYLAKLLNVDALYALKMSEEAVAQLKESDISYFYQNRVKLLMNKDDSDLDVYDKAIIAVEGSSEAHKAINSYVSELRIKAFWENRRNGALNYTRIIDISNGQTAISSLYDSYGINDIRLPRKKDKMIGVDEFGMPIAIVENIEINVTPLRNIDEELASKEGLSLEEWKQHKVPLLLAEAEKIGVPANDDLWVLFEIFKQNH